MFGRSVNLLLWEVNGPRALALMRVRRKIPANATYTSGDKTINNSRYLFSSGAAMKFSFEVGQDEKHQIEFQWSRFADGNLRWADKRSTLFGSKRNGLSSWRPLEPTSIACLSMGSWRVNIEVSDPWAETFALNAQI
jgi:hypothetical protein